MFNKVDHIELFTQQTNQKTRNTGIAVQANLCMKYIGNSYFLNKVIFHCNSLPAGVVSAAALGVN